MKQTLLLLSAGLTLMFTSCEENVEKNNTDQKQREDTEKMFAEAERQVGMPTVSRWQERKLMKMIIEERDREDLICYAYTVNLNGDKIFLGKCLGYGLPYSVQFTNPERVWMENDLANRSGLASSYNDVGGTIPMPDPNGLFMPEGLAATWLMLIDPSDGKPRPVYVEPEILVSPFPLHQLERTATKTKPVETP